MTEIHIIGQAKCKFCDLAKEQAEKHGYKPKVKILKTNAEKQSFVDAGFKTVPQIYIDGNHIGGCEDFLTWLENI